MRTCRLAEQHPTLHGSSTRPAEAASRGPGRHHRYKHCCFLCHVSLYSLCSVSHVTWLEVAGHACRAGLPQFLYICAGQHVQPGRQCKKVKLSPRLTAPPPRSDIGGSSVCDHAVHAGQAASSDQGAQSGNVPQHVQLHKEGQQVRQAGEQRAPLNTAVPSDNIAASVKRNRRAASHIPGETGFFSRVQLSRRIQAWHCTPALMTLVLHQSKMLLPSHSRPLGMSLEQGPSRHTSTPSAFMLAFCFMLRFLEGVLHHDSCLAWVRLCHSGLAVPMAPACCMRSVQNDSNRAAACQGICYSCRVCNTHAYLQACRAAPHLAWKQHVAGRSGSESTWTTPQVQKRICLCPLVFVLFALCITMTLLNFCLICMQNWTASDSSHVCRSA